MTITSIICIIISTLALICLCFWRVNQIENAQVQEDKICDRCGMKSDDLKRSWDAQNICDDCFMAPWDSFELAKNQPSDALQDILNKQPKGIQDLLTEFDNDQLITALEIIKRKEQYHKANMTKARARG